MYSLSRTLSVRFSVTMFVALLVIALWAYLGAQRVLRAELDRGLAAAAHLEAATLAASQSLPLEPVLEDRQAFIEAINRFVVARAADGRMLAYNTPLAEGMPYDEAALLAAVSGNQGWATTAWGHGQLRAVYLPVAAGIWGDARVVQVAASLGPHQTASRDVLFLMLGTVLLGMIATVFGAGWLARSAALPVAEIVQQAEEIEAGQVGQRITAHAEVTEFTALIRVLNRMLERLDRGLLSQRRIIADAGHDLRTPITAMQGEIEVALRKPRPTERYEAVLRSLLEEVNHLQTISDSLLMLARIETGELVPEPKTADLDGVVRDAVRRVSPRAGSRQIAVEGVAESGTAALDPELIGLALDQLLDNAVRHTPDGTDVSVGTATGNGRVTITVEDGGPGVPPDVLPHLFERFYRGDAARGRTAGAGLGLTVAAAIVAAHGGSIAADQGPTGGLRIQITLPKEGPGKP